MTYCHIHIRIKFDTQIAESVRILGNLDQLGAWSSATGLALVTDAKKYPYWETETAIRAPTGITFLFNSHINLVKELELNSRQQSFVMASLRGGRAFLLTKIGVIELVITEWCLAALKDSYKYPKRLRRNLCLANLLKVIQNIIPKE